MDATETAVEEQRRHQREEVERCRLAREANPALKQPGKTKTRTQQEAVAEIVETIALSGLMKPEQAAQYLLVTPSTLAVWRSTNRKKLAYVKVGGQVRYRREDLDRFITEGLRNAA